MKKFFGFFLVLLVLAGGMAVSAAGVFPPYVRIGLTRDFGNRESIPIATARIQVGYEVNGVFTPERTLESAVGFVARVNTSHQVVLYAGGSRVFTFDRTCTEPQVREAGGGNISLGTATYRGRIALRAVNRLLTVVNIICPEEYLFGVLPAEVYLSWHDEAMRAQAVASRTFLYRRANEGRHAAQGFHLCDTTCCQVYRGVQHENLRTTEAVLYTAGLLIFYNNEPILASFFSSSGGATDNSENVWVEARPYLRSVRSISEPGARQWTRTFTWAQLTQLANAANAGIGNVTGVSVTGIGASGRVQELTIIGTNGRLVLTGERTRTFFTSIGGTLDSRNYRIIEALPVLPAVWVYDGRQLQYAPLSTHHGLDNRGHAASLHMAYVFDGYNTRRITHTPTTVTGGTGITIVGSGWGHGVGMSQHGAQGMALLGYNFREILMHYYTGVEIR